MRLWRGWVLYWGTCPRVKGGPMYKYKFGTVDFGSSCRQAYWVRALSKLRFDA